MIEAAPAPTPAAPEAPLDDASPEDRLLAALRVHGSDLLDLAGQLTVEQRRDGTISRWLWRDIKQTVGRLEEAIAEFRKEKPADA